MKEPVDLTVEFIERAKNGAVGDRLVSETDRVRVWHIRAKPGERLKVHTINWIISGLYTALAGLETTNLTALILR